MHFYPGLAQYEESDGNSYKVYLNEKTLRSMDSTFAGKPVFVEHVSEVAGSIDEIRKEADGWVVESFFNAADGKHWVKMVIVTEQGINAIKNGYRLSNAYVPKSFMSGGVWNGIEYSKEITGGEYEHLALVQNPRYEESVIMTPEEFKKHNSDQELELKKIANSKGEKKMGLSFFKRAKVENSVEIESTVVVLPKSKKEMLITDLVVEMDKVLNMAGYASDDHMVKLHDGSEMSVKDLTKNYGDMCNKMEEMKKKSDGMEEGDDKDKENSEESLAEDEKDVGDRGGDKHLKGNESDEDENKKNDDMEKDEKKKNDIEKAKALKNAGLKFENEAGPRIDLMVDKLARGKELF